MQKVLIKPPYLMAALDREIPHSEAEYRLMVAIDHLMLERRNVELTCGAKENLEAIMQKHVEQAFEYYSQFSKTDISKLSLLSEMVADAIENEGKENDDG